MMEEIKQLIKQGVKNKDWALIAQAILLFNEEQPILVADNSKKSKKTSKKIGVKSKNLSKTMTIYSGDLSVAEQKSEQKINKKLINKNKQKRDPYKPLIKKCDQCKDSFDFKKEYPAGLMDKSSEVLCYQCKNRKRK